MAQHSRSLLITPPFLQGDGAFHAMTPFIQFGSVSPKLIHMEGRIFTGDLVMFSRVGVRYLTHLLNIEILLHRENTDKLCSGAVGIQHVYLLFYCLLYFYFSLIFYFIIYYLLFFNSLFLLHICICLFIFAKILV